MMGQRELECKETQWSSHVGLVHNIRESVCISKHSGQATLEFLSHTKKKTEISDISDLIIIDAKTRSRFFRCCLEMIKRINEDTEMKMKSCTALTNCFHSFLCVCFVFVAFWHFLPWTSYYYKD